GTTGRDGLTVTPLICTWPPRQASAAALRVLNSRTDHSQLSTRTDCPVIAGPSFRAARRTPSGPPIAAGAAPRSSPPVRRPARGDSGHSTLEHVLLCCSPLQTLKDVCL